MDSIPEQVRTFEDAVRLIKDTLPEASNHESTLKVLLSFFESRLRKKEDSKVADDKRAYDLADKLKKGGDALRPPAASTDIPINRTHDEWRLK